MKRSIIVGTILLLVATAFAQAQNRSDQMTDLLGYFPVGWLTPDQNVGIYFHDIAASRRAIVRRALVQGSLDAIGGQNAYLRLSLLNGDLVGACCRNSWRVAGENRV